jgi:nucleotide-binding universal stress UspA family protein
MKTLLVPTDFSSMANHAAEYGHNLAKQIKANIILCNVVTVPAEIPQAGAIVWPIEEYDVLIKDSADELKRLKKQLDMNDTNDNYPNISCLNEMGVVTDVIDLIISKHKVDLIVMGMHSADGISTFMLGNHSRNMINKTAKPLLLIPYDAAIVPIRKIAFATDFKQPGDDLEAIYSLIPLARLMNAEILLTHVYNEKNHSPEFERWVKEFFIELSNKANYPHIYYRLIKNRNTEAGLDWICENGQIDMLVMVHRSHNLLDSLLNGSHTQKMANHIAIPLLVFPAK